LQYFGEEEGKLLLSNNNSQSFPRLAIICNIGNRHGGGSAVSPMPISNIAIVLGEEEGIWNYFGGVYLVEIE
jgi:hypothetical protein